MYARALVIAAILAAASAGAFAENVDPFGSGEQWAWAENAGWINAQPLGPGGPGMEVGDFWVSGWLWGENIGWINLNCLNDGSCGTVNFGVQNDGSGHLSGFAWAENTGWINFSPSGGGVTIGSGGVITGWAWGENIGWLNFSPTGAGTVAIRTSWGCAAVAPPIGSPVLSLVGSTDTELTWTALPDATVYDIVRGNLARLLASHGDFSLSEVICASRKQAGLSLINARTRDNPVPGGGLFYLVRGANCAGNGTYNDGGPGLSGSRDAGIAASGGDCL